MALPVNIDVSYEDDPARPSRKVHQQHHDTVHADANDIRAAYDAAVVGGFAGTFAAWVLTLDDVASAATGALTFVTGLATDGTGNQASAINAAINALPAAGATFDPRGGGTVRLPPGIIRITTSIILKDNVILEGSGAGTIILVDANIEGIKATATDAFGMRGWHVRDLKMMTGSTTTTAVAIATHAFGVASGGFVFCSVERVEVAKTGGGTPVYGKFLKGLSLDFFIECVVRDVHINTGLLANSIGVELLNASNATPLDGVVIRECVKGVYIDGNSLVPIIGSTIEGCSVYGVHVYNGRIESTDSHYENATGSTDIYVRAGQSGSIKGGELVTLNFAGNGVNTVNDWTVSHVLIRSTATVGTGALNTIFIGCGSPATDSGVNTTYISARPGGISTYSRFGSPVKLGVSVPLVLTDANGVEWSFTVGVDGELVLPTPPPGTPVNDTFTRTGTSLGIATPSGHVWVPNVGTWATNGTQGYVTTNNGNARATVKTGIADGTVSVTLPVATNAGMVFRYVDASNYWVVGNAGQYVDKVVAGVQTNVLGYNSVGVDGDAISVVLAGSSITLKRNGVTLGTPATDATHATATRHGLYVQSLLTARFDSFTVTA